MIWFLLIYFILGAILGIGVYALGAVWYDWTLENDSLGDNIAKLLVLVIFWPVTVPITLVIFCAKKIIGDINKNKRNRQEGVFRN